MLLLIGERKEVQKMGNVIQIHLMLLLITGGAAKKAGEEAFKYISCYY